VDLFDSRALRYTDSFGQRFMRSGRYPYDLRSAAWGGLRRPGPRFVIDVSKERTRDRMTQHDVRVLVEGNGLVADPPELSVGVGDMVLFATRVANAPPFVVLGEQDFFSSAALSTEAGYAHAFGVPGEYRWVDANGSRLHGTVRVTTPEENEERDRDAWLGALSKGTLIMIEGDECDPREVDIVTGQTVFWAVTKAPGVSITDARLLQLSET
jgi:plastocyanin